ncbi:distal tail protein Dit [Virgibacillus doumboii]|uniref:distal tail protein Dit n=1 Tax=Virgibacillus doumboii TaxID=2697503 RepID=UPI0013E0D3C0|nr:distal tail protein Dit [Virgibacillus doumboii]
MLDMTYEEYMGEVFHLWHDGTDYSEYFDVLEVTGRSLSPNEISSVRVPGMPGAHFQRKRKNGVPLKVKVLIRCNTDEELRQRLDTLNGMLDTEDEVPIQFSDEQDKTYFGILSDISEGIEVNGNHIVTITFWRSNPYKYGPEQPIGLTGRGTIIEVPGTAETKPIIEIDVLAPITFAMISNGTDYMMIGNPTAVEETPVEAETKVFHHDMDSKTGWVNTSVISEGYINGTMANDTTGFYPQFAEPNPGEFAWHGPAKKHSLSEAVQDFRADFGFRFYAESRGGTVGRIEMYGLDASNNIVFRAWIEDKWDGYDHFGVCLELGNGDRTEYFTLPRNLEDMYGRLKVIRKGNEWTLIIQHLKSGAGRIVLNEWTEMLESDLVMQQVSQIQLSFQKWYDTDEEDMEVLLMRLYKLNNVEGTPYIAHTGDTILFDLKNHDIRINGEKRKDLKDRGATEFDLLPGKNKLALLPDGDVQGVIKFRPAYK